VVQQIEAREASVVMRLGSTKRLTELPQKKIEVIVLECKREPEMTGIGSGGYEEMTGIGSGGFM